MNEKDRVGYANVGNSCYAAAVMQCLAACPHFLTHLVADIDSRVSPESRNDNKQDFRPLIASCIAQRLVCNASVLFPAGVTLHAKYYQDTRALFSTTLRVVCHQSAMIDFGQQNDAHEYMLAVFDVLERSGQSRRIRRILRSRHGPTVNPHGAHVAIFQAIRAAWRTFLTNSSGIGATLDFYGQQTHVSRCASCAKISYGFDVFCSLPLRHGSVSEMVREEARRIETVEGYACDGCKRAGLTRRQVVLSYTPRLLTFQVMRFVGRSPSDAKDQRDVTLEEDVDLSDITMPTNYAMPDATTTDNRAEYTLVAAVCHVGSSLDSGHYYAVCKQRAGWVVYDDDGVRPIRGIEAIPGAHPYMLFYSAV